MAERPDAARQSGRSGGSKDSSRESSRSGSKDRSRTSRPATGRSTGAPAPARRTIGRRGPWRMLPAGSTAAARLPFVLLVVGLLVAGLITLLMLNTALNEGSFRLSNMQKHNKERAEEAADLRQQIERWSAPDSLSDRAREFGMVPGGNPAFLQPDGSALGKPEEARGPTRQAAAEEHSGGKPSLKPDQKPGKKPDKKPGTARRGAASPSPHSSPDPNPNPSASLNPSPSTAAPKHRG